MKEQVEVVPYEGMVWSKNEDHFVSKIEVADHESDEKKFLTLT